MFVWNIVGIPVGHKIAYHDFLCGGLEQRKDEVVFNVNWRQGVCMYVCICRLEYNICFVAELLLRIESLNDRLQYCVEFVHQLIEQYRLSVDRVRLDYYLFIIQSAIINPITRQVRLSL